MKDIKVRFTAEIEGLDELVKNCNYFGANILKELYYSQFRSLAVGIWNESGDIMNGGLIDRYNKLWDDAFGDESYMDRYEEEYDNYYNELQQKVMDYVSSKYPLNLSSEKYILKLVGGTEAITFKLPENGEEYGEGTIKCKLERVLN